MFTESRAKQIAEEIVAWLMKKEETDLPLHVTGDPLYVQQELTQLITKKFDEFEHEEAEDERWNASRG